MSNPFLQQGNVNQLVVSKAPIPNVRSPNSNPSNAFGNVNSFNQTSNSQNSFGGFSQGQQQGGFFGNQSSGFGSFKQGSFGNFANNQQPVSNFSSTQGPSTGGQFGLNPSSNIQGGLNQGQKVGFGNQTSGFGNFGQGNFGQKITSTGTSEPKTQFGSTPSNTQDGSLSKFGNVSVKKESSPFSGLSPTTPKLNVGTGTHVGETKQISTFGQNTQSGSSPFSRLVNQSTSSPGFSTPISSVGQSAEAKTSPFSSVVKQQENKSSDLTQQTSKFGQSSEAKGSSYGSIFNQQSNNSFSVPSKESDTPSTEPKTMFGFESLNISNTDQSATSSGLVKSSDIEIGRCTGPGLYAEHLPNEAFLIGQIPEEPPC